MDRIAVIADIHGNADALDAVLRDIASRGVDGMVNLGDCFSGPLDAGRTARILRANPMPTVRGNHDRYLIEQSAQDMHPSDRVAHDQLGLSDMEWLATLPRIQRLDGDILLCHATPTLDEVYWLETVTADGHTRLATPGEITARTKGDWSGVSLALCGHSHVPRVLRHGKLLIVNPGSVGCPAYSDDMPTPHRVETGSPAARYAIAQRSARSWTVEQIAIPYDPSRMAEMARANDRPDWAHALESGRLP
ncbi:metallophosphoesterase family protein [Pseudoprimorskyibacter insulae]|uniref:Calcineurin-like phosphoesterase domain-containing protein n=1 Tax=Pseudoprimorskyibacter insulae TaxID=1695997 RepID=A0A2R8AQZ0_9RHOB|nr:metallophosphoesterase family protein [Pseudoprimorskyibacter insulae]SPF78472.1 hypothetical protein PRI8871_01075 [Pseudoprimorskyibacter insulae]